MRRGIQLEGEPRSKRTVLHITQSMYRELVELSGVTGMSQTEIMVRAFHAYKGRFKGKGKPSG